MRKAHPDGSKSGKKLSKNKLVAEKVTKLYGKNTLKRSDIILGA